MSTSSRSYRISVDLPDDLVADVKNQAKLDDTALEELWFHWLALAALLAHRGYGHLLPQGRRAPRGTAGPVQKIRWRQGRERVERCRQEIEAAGSSISAVLREAGKAYVDARGDHLAMSWPGSWAEREAA